MSATAAFQDYGFLARHQVRAQRPSGLMRFLMDAVAALVPHEGTPVLLDVGGGTNSYLTYLGPAYRKVVCDPVAESLAGMRGVETLQAGLPETGLPAGFADWVSAVEVLEHLPEATYQASLEELARLSRRFVAITVPFCQHLESALVRCARCRRVYQCEGHLRRFESEDVFRLQGYFGGLVRLGFAVAPRRPRTMRLLYQAKRLRHWLRRFGICSYAKPPLTKCPHCGHEEFHDYEVHRQRALSPDDRYWLVEPARVTGSLVGERVMAVFDRQSQ